MPNPVETDVEKRLNAMMAEYGNTPHIRYLGGRFKKLVDEVQAQDVPTELIAFAVAQHAAAMVAAMKLARLIRPELADALGEDFLETINRAMPGATDLASKQ